MIGMLTVGCQILSIESGDNVFMTANNHKVDEKMRKFYSLG